MAAYSGIKLVHLSAILIASFFIPLAVHAQQTAAEGAKTPQVEKPAVDRPTKDEEKIKLLSDCSLAKTNNDCKLMIDRLDPITPPTIQMYSNQTLTVIIKNPNGFERYFLDYQSGQANLTPDVAATIIQGLLPSLQKVQEIHGYDLVREPPTDHPCAAKEIKSASVPDVGKVSTVLKPVTECVAHLATKAIEIYQQLEPYVAPDSRVPNGEAGEKRSLEKIGEAITAFITSENVLSTKISSIAGDADYKNNTDANGRTQDARTILELTELQKLADAVVTDFLGYSARIRDLGGFIEKGYRNEFRNCSYLMDDASVPPDQCIWITSKMDREQVYQNMVTRTITYSLNTLNLISNSQEAVPDSSKKKLLTPITLNFADNSKKVAGVPYSRTLRWEASAGAFFSTLPVRSFSVVPVFTNGVITDKMIGQNILHPTVVPFAAANYRLTDDLHWTRWKSNIYLTGAIGVNPNTVTADFAAGLSFSFRALMVSGLAHFGHDVSLTQGLTIGESLGASFNGTLPTQTHWTTAFGVGLSIRVPSLVGR